MFAQIVYFGVRAKDQAMKMILAFGKVPFASQGIAEQFSGKVRVRLVSVPLTCRPSPA